MDETHQPRGPRPEEMEYTGSGTPRSADDGLQEPGALGDREDPHADPAVVTGATTSSHPSAVDDVDVNRSGSGGSGGASVEGPAEEDVTA